MYFSICICVFVFVFLYNSLFCSGVLCRGLSLVFYEIGRILMCAEQAERPPYICPACALLDTELQKAKEMADIVTFPKDKCNWQPLPPRLTCLCKNKLAKLGLQIPMIPKNLYKFPKRIPQNPFQNPQKILKNHQESQRII